MVGGQPAHEVSTNDLFLFNTPPTEKGTIVSVYQSCAMGGCSCQHQIGGIQAQLLPCRFASFIFARGHEVSDEYWELFQGIADGFDIVDSAVEGYDCDNYISITSGPAKDVMDRNIAEELDEGRISNVEDKPTCIHALGAVPKSSGGYRTITDCSRPEGKSVNAHSTSLAPKFQFKNIEYAVDMLEQDDMMSVIDIKSAYRAVPINPEHWTLQGFRWPENGEVKMYIDHRMCFGVRTGPYYFNLISNFIHDTMVESHNIRLMNYLDDFLVIGGDKDSCEAAQAKVIGFIRYLGFHISWHKVTPPSKSVQYLGIIVDSELMELRMPSDKLERLRTLLCKYSDASFIGRKELESLTGLLAHCSQCVRGGRTFCRRLYDLYKYMVNKGAKRAWITDIVREDIKWWKCFATIFNGVSAMNNEVYHEDIYTDASKKGFGAHLGSDWLAGTWGTVADLQMGDTSGHCHIASPPISDIYDEENINELELWAVLSSLIRWQDHFKGKSVNVFTDNMQVYHNILSGRSRNVTNMSWIREIFWLCAIMNICLIPNYVPTQDNVVADTLSRLPYDSTRREAEGLLCSYDLCCSHIIYDFCRGLSGEIDGGE